MLRALPPLVNGRLRRRDRSDHQRLFRLRWQFERVSRRLERPRRRRRAAQQAAAAVAIGIVAGCGYAALDLLFAWSPTTIGRHLVAAPGCSTARSVGLAPAGRGEPGYYRWHDRDRDGIACEATPEP